MRIDFFQCGLDRLVVGYVEHDASATVAESFTDRAGSAVAGRRADYGCTGTGKGGGNSGTYAAGGPGYERHFTLERIGVKEIAHDCSFTGLQGGALRRLGGIFRADNGRRRDRQCSSPERLATCLARIRPRSQLSRRAPPFLVVM